MAAKDEDIGGVGQRAAGAVAANKLEVVEGYPGKEKGKGAVNQIQPPTDGGVIKNPKAHAYAAAKQAAFSSVGRVITPGKDGNDRFQGRYQMGWAKGMTPDQANQAFDTKFANVDPRIQEKYAKIGDPASKLAPSEKAAQLKQQRDEEAKENPVPKADTTSFDKDQNGVPDSIQKPDATVTSRPAPGSDEARAAALTENARNERFATATVGNYMDMQAAVGAQRANDPDLEGVGLEIRQRDAAIAREKQAAASAAEAARVKAKQDQARASAGLSAQPTPTTTPAFVGPPAPAAPAAAAAAAPAPAPAPAAPAAPARTYDFESGEGKELTGIVNGRKTYTKAAELYGPAKPSIPNTIAATPATADATKPVMIQGQSIDQQRADHQARNQNVAAADRAMSSTTAVSPIAQKVPSRPAIPRGPASQPIQTSYKRNDPTVDQGAVDKYLSAVRDSHNYGGTDEEYNRRKAAPEEISKASNEVTRLKMGGALALQGTAIDKPVIQKPVRPMLARR